MKTFTAYQFEANNFDDAIQQVLVSPAIPKNVQKIAKDIINNFPKNTYDNGIYWITSDKEVFECYGTPYGYIVVLESKYLPNDLVMSCYGRVDQSNAIPPFRSRFSDVQGKIFEYEQAIKGKHTERGAMFDANGNIIYYASGDNSTTPFIYLENAVYCTHSHPDLADNDEDEKFRKIHFGTSFSSLDFNAFLQLRNVKQERVVFSNGIVMVCEKTKPKLTSADINLALKMLLKNKSEIDTDKQYDQYVLENGKDWDDDFVKLNRKLVKYSYEKDKSVAANLGLHIFFILKDGRMVEHLKGKKTTTPKKKSVSKSVIKSVKRTTKRTPKRIGDNFNDLIF